MKGSLLLLRILFVITTASTFYQLSVAVFDYPPFSFINILSIIIGSFSAVFIIWIEIQYTIRFIMGIFTVILGLLIGFVASHLFIQALYLIPHIKLLKQAVAPSKMTQIDDAIKVGITFFFCYLSVAILFRTRNRFKLLIPFVELNKETQEKHLVLDSSIIIDGRIVSVCKTNILSGTFVIPKFILNELQALADSSDKKKRLRGRRGIDIIAQLQDIPNIRIDFYSDIFPDIKEVDDKLIAMTQKISGVLITNDYNLKKIAELQNIEVISFNTLSNALRPPVIPEDILNIHIIKPGEEDKQGIGYLDDGTVVIIEDGVHYIGQNIEVLVTNVLQTNMGRMVFGKPK